MKIRKKIKIIGGIALAVALPFITLRSLDVGNYRGRVMFYRHNRSIEQSEFSEASRKLKESITDLRTFVLSTDNQITERNKGIIDAQRALDELSPGYEEARKNRNAVDAELDAAKGSSDSLENAIETKKGEVSEKRARISELEASIIPLREEKGELEKIRLDNKAYLDSLVDALAKIKPDNTGDFSGYLTSMFGGANKASVGVRFTGYPDFLNLAGISFGPFVSYTQGIESMADGGDRGVIFAGLNGKWQPVKRFFFDGSVHNAYNNKGERPIKGKVAVGAGAGVYMGKGNYFRGGVDYINSQEVFLSFSVGKDFDFRKRKR